MIKLCYNIKDLPLYIRTRKEGDKILVNGKLKNLSDYLTNKIRISKKIMLLPNFTIALGLKDMITD